MKRIEITCFNDVNGKALTEVYYGYTKEEAFQDMKRKIGSDAYIAHYAESGKNDKPAKKPKNIYVVWNLTNYDMGFEFYGAYTTKAQATKAYKALMKQLYGTTNEDKLLELCEDENGCVDSWRIVKIALKG